ncbi:MAG TPA: ABC transporter permease [Streptosporangiaceae bacterium]
MNGNGGLPPSRLRPADLFRVATAGLRTRRLRAGLSALGIAIGVAALVAVLGLSASSSAGLLAQIDRLGTNLLTATSGSSITGDAAKMPVAAASMIGRIPPVTAVAQTGETGQSVYRTPLIPKIQTGGISVKAASIGLPQTVGTRVVSGRYLNAATERQPVAVLGAQAAKQLGFGQVTGGQKVWIGNHWFYLAGILAADPLAPEIDSSVLVGFPAAEKYLDFDGHPGELYVRAVVDQVQAVQGVLAATANPESPSEITVSQPSAALVARAQASSTLTSLFLGLGAVALLVGGVGVANIMVISVLERRGEIGLRRALGSTRAHIRVQFLGEALLLSVLGGAAGVLFGAAATWIYAATRGWAVVVPPLAWAGGLAASLVIGGVAGLLPAIRAARMPPTEALRTL